MTALTQTLRMPKFLVLLFFVEMWERFSYYGMRSLLVLFLTSSLGFADPKAYAIYSLFAALGYAGPVIGGWLADRLTGFRYLVTLGGVLISIGHILLALVNFSTSLLYLGLGFIAVGTGMFKGNISNLLGCCYQKDDPERARGFVLFYVSVNLGSVLASILCGYVAHVYGWHFGFGLAALGMLAGLSVFARFQRILGSHGLAPQPEQLRKSVLGSPLTVSGAVILTCFFAAGVSAFLLQAHGLFTQLLSFFGLGVLVILAFVFKRASSDERRSLTIIATLLVFFTCFFAMEMQLGSLINLFTQRNVDKTIFGLSVPASVSQAINPFSIIIFGPLLSPLFVRFGNRWSMLRFGLGLATMVVCFLLLYFASFHANEQGQVPYIFLVVSIAFMGVGELCIAPLIYSICTALSPLRIRGFMMGVVNLAMSFANLAGIIIAGFMSVPKNGAGQDADAFASLAVYQAGFYQIMMFNIGLVAVFALFYPFLNRACRLQLGEPLPQQTADLKAQLACET